MAVQLTGYSNQINQGSKQGFDELKAASREDARRHLTELRSDLRTKSGVVRLLHTTKTKKDMKFKNAGAFKRVFLSGNKLRRSGDVIKDLLKNAGLSNAKVEEFGRYAAARGKKGVEAQKVLQYIDALQADEGSSAASALAKFGVDLGAMGRRLGDGAFGEVHQVTYRGEDYVYKSAVAPHPWLGELTLADEGGKAIQPGKTDPVAQNKSFTEVDKDDQDDRLLIPERQNNGLIHRKSNEYDYVPSDSGSEREEQDQSYAGQFQRYMQVESKSPSGLESFVDQDSNLMQEGSFVSDSPRSSSQISEEAKPEKSDKTIVQAPATLIMEEKEQAQHNDPSKPAQAEQKLARTGLANAARVKDLPQVITPSVFVVKERRQNGAEKYHAVAGQKTLKDWAKIQNKGSSFEVVGLLMPKAAGKNPIDNPENGDPKVHVSRSDLKPMAESAMKLLKGMARHGFIHGDIKPANLMWDAKSKKLQLIDNDNLVKVSKNKGSVVPKGLGAYTSTYLNPVVTNPTYRDELSIAIQPKHAQLGLGRDLYAMGLVLLETSLRASGERHEDTEKKMWELTLGGSLAQLSSRSIQDQIKSITNTQVEANTVQDFARTCLIKALEFEQGRIDRKDFGFNRSPDGPEMTLLRELEQVLKNVR